jgi:hypothetical protein
MSTGAFTRIAGVLMAGGLVLALLLDGAFVVLGVTVAVTAGILLALRLDPEHRPAADDPLAPVAVGAEPVLDVEPGELG